MMTDVLWILPLALGIAVHSGHAQAQDAKAGQTVFLPCTACHQIGPHARDQLGPPLNGVLERRAGMVPGHDYTDAMKNSGVAYDDESLTEFLRNPDVKVPGTRTRFAGFRSDRDISNLLAYAEDIRPRG